MLRSGVQLRCSRLLQPEATWLISLSLLTSNRSSRRDPFLLAGTIYVAGELRLFIVSVGADAQLTAVVAEQPNGDLAVYIRGEACGHVSFLFFDIEGCVEITISGPKPSAPMPVLVDKIAIKSRSPALLVGPAWTAVST